MKRTNDFFSIFNHSLIFTFLSFTLINGQEIKNYGIPAPSLGNKNISLRVYFPSNYDANNTNVVHRVFIYLHGSEGHSSGQMAAVVEPAVASLVNTGSISPTIVIFPELVADVDPYYRNVHLYANSEYYGGFEDVLTKDILVWLQTETDLNIKDKVRIERKYLVLAGFSMGGDGAIRVGLRNPDIFGGLIPHSSDPSLDGRITDPILDNVRNESQFINGKYTYSTTNFWTEIVYGWSAAWGPLDNSGKIQFILKEDGGVKRDIFDIWLKQADSRTIMRDRNLYKENEGPYIYITAGSQGDIAFEGSELFAAKERVSEEMPEEYINWAPTELGHKVDEDVVKEAIQWINDRLDAIVVADLVYEKPNPLFRIQPNIVKSADQVEFFLFPKQRFTNYSLRIFDQSAKLLRKIEILNTYNEPEIALTLQSPEHSGIYYFQLFAEGILETKRLIVQ